MEIFIAPVQGHTDAAWRHFHKKIYGGDNLYFTPFIRYEHGEIRSKDLRDFKSQLNDTIQLEPQVIFRNTEELEALISTLKDTGAKRINLNMGCPFPLQTGKGRGAGFIRNIEEAKKIPEVLSRFPDIKYSVKMRLGFENPDEWKGIIDILNSIELTRIFLHPRVAKQQYGGDLYSDKFKEFLAASKNAVVFNGEIKTPADIKYIETEYPSISGIMTARGILGRPSLAEEYNEEWSKDRRIERMLKFHRELFNHYENTLCGDAQILSKIKPFWEYAEVEIGRKAWKAIRKATSMAKYNSAVALVGN